MSEINPNCLSAKEAIRALECGLKVAHSTWEPNEYIKMRKFALVDDQDLIQGDSEMFFKDRSQTGWRIWKPAQE